MNYPLYTLILRLLLCAFLAAGFIFDYMSALETKKILGYKDEIIQSQKSTIESQDKNIAMRKEKMGY